MEAHVHKGMGHVLEGRGPAQMFALVVGAVLTVLGVAGFLVNADFSTGSSVSADTLIVFDVNGWLNLIHLATGLAGIYAATRADIARKYVIAVGAVYLVLAVWGVFAETIIGMLPVNAPDTILHAAIGAVAVMVALGPDHADA